jgi:NAD(P)-dependent dehydrogenase (short-subunit alcohol dehydrogenase family)
MSSDASTFSSTTPASRNAHRFSRSIRWTGGGRSTSISPAPSTARKQRLARWRSATIAKAGIIGLTRAAALDLADYGVTVNAIAPGPIETELMLGVWSAEALRERPQHGAIARFGTVDEIAHTALFLASPDSGFITGVTIPVDGGAASSGADMVEKYRRRKFESSEGRAEPGSPS